MASANHVERARAEGTIFGIPMGDLGWFQSLLMGLATGFAAFFLTTFVAIVAMLLEQMFTHRVPPYDHAYKLIGFPVGVVVGVAALGYLAVLYTRQIATKRRTARS
ncbi:hypothetical protein ACFQBQ_10505 [Granulicella cerasi]|uniref:Uncharacterized protein n=1 Tax=Granulicella cerasi TaxID=741063 RepID=A0ABW1ZAY0_9BACT|nr:hypothetical protein [Granulicella cerasi]